MKRRNFYWRRFAAPKRFAALLCALILAAPSFGADAFPPGYFGNSINYSQYSKNGGAAVWALPAGRFEIRRDSVYAAEVGTLGGFFTAAGPFLVVGAIAATALAVVKDDQPAPSETCAANEVRDESGNCRPPQNTVECQTINPNTVYDENARTCISGGAPPREQIVPCENFQVRDNISGICRLPRNTPECQLLYMNDMNGIFDGNAADRCAPAPPNPAARLCADNEVRDRETSACRLPQNTAECQTRNATEIYNEDAADKCEPAPPDNTANPCSNTEVRDRITRLCRMPQNTPECQILNSGEVFDDNEADKCAPAPATGAPPCGLAEVRDQESGNCRPPQNTAECQILNPGEIFDGNAADKCAPAPPNPAARLCADNEVRDRQTSICRLPQNTAECQTRNPNEIYNEDAADKCVAAPAPCAANQLRDISTKECRFPNNESECRAINTDETFDPAAADNCSPVLAPCNATQVRDRQTAECRAPQNTAECKILNSGDIFDSVNNTCIADSPAPVPCAADEVRDRQTSECRAPENTAECKIINPDNIYDSVNNTCIADNTAPAPCAADEVRDRQTSECRAPENTAECKIINVNNIFDSGNNTCIADNTAPVPCAADEVRDRQTSECRAPENTAECKIINPDNIYDSGNNTCIADNTAPVPCAADEVRDRNNGDCRAPENTPECKIINPDNIYDSVNNTCIADNTAPVPCTADEVRDRNNGNCRAPVNTAECRILNLGAIYDTAQNACMITVCAAREVRDGINGECRAPETTAECQMLDAQMEFNPDANRCAFPFSATGGGRDRIFHDTRLTLCLEGRDGTGGNDDLRSHVFTPVRNGYVVPALPGEESGALASAVVTLEGSSLNGVSGLFGYLERATELRSAVNGAGGRVWKREGSTWIGANDYISHISNIDNALLNGPIYDNGGFNRVQAGDVIAITDDNLSRNTSISVVVSRIVAIFRVYHGRLGDLNVATGAVTQEYRDEGVTLAIDEQVACNLPDEASNTFNTTFFLGGRNERVRNLGESRFLDEFIDEFTFQDISAVLDGELTENNSARLGNFSFTADSSLKNLRMEYAYPEIKTGDFLWRAHSGYRREHGGKTEIYYQKSGAEYAPEGANWKIYTASTAGRIRSEIYENTPLHGLSAGFFHGKLLRHNDSYHIRLHTPFSANQVREWEFSADARAGTPDKHLRLQLYRNISREVGGARLTYRQRF